MARAALQDTRGHARFRSWARSPGHAPTAGARSSVGTPPRGPPDPRGLRGPRHQGRRRPAGTGRGVNSEVPPPAARHRGVPDTGTLATASPAGPGSNSGQLPPEGQAGEGHPPGAPLRRRTRAVPSRPGHQAHARHCCSSSPSIRSDPRVDTSPVTSTAPSRPASPTWGTREGKTSARAEMPHAHTRYARSRKRT